MNRIEKGCNNFREGFNCSQSVFTVFSQKFGIHRETALKLSCGFGAGFGREQEICGALSGGIMVIGLHFGQYIPDDRESREKTYSTVRKFLNSFREINGTTICSRLLNCDLNTEAGRKKFTEENLKENVCVKCVRDAIKLVEEIIRQQE